MGINGVMESYTSAIITKGEISTMNWMMTLFSLLHFGIAVVLLHSLDIGTIGLIIANSVNMLLRIAWCYKLISKYFSRHNILFPNLYELLPSPSVAAAFGTSFVAIKCCLCIIGEESLSEKAYNLSFGAMCSGLVLLVM